MRYCPHVPDFNIFGFIVCNLSIFGMQLGMLLGFVTTPWLVHMHESLEDIAADLNRLNYFHLGLVSFQLVLVVSGK